jgi:putative copper export protein
MKPDLLSVIIRALGFVALFQAAGAAFFLATFGESLACARTPIRRVALSSAALGAILILAHLGLDAARLSGDFEGLWDEDLQRLAWTSRSGISQMVQALGLVAVLAGLWKPGRSHARWASAGGVIAVGGFLITGHTSTHALRAVLGPLLALHLLVVAFWFGALVPLAVVIRLEPRTTAAEVLKRFSVIAGWLVPLILVAGLTMAWLLTGSLSVLAKPYGELLLAKLAGFGLLMVLAAYNKWRLTPAFEQARSESSLRRSMAAEYVLIVAVLSVTAVLTAFYSPE